jgi:hypothetical protein
LLLKSLPFLLTLRKIIHLLIDCFPIRISMCSGCSSARLLGGKSKDESYLSHAKQHRLLWTDACPLLWSYLGGLMVIGIPGSGDTWLSLHWGTPQPSKWYMWPSLSFLLHGETNGFPILGTPQIKGGIPVPMFSGGFRIHGWSEIHQFVHGRCKKCVISKP